MDRELKIMLLDLKAEVAKLRREVMWMRQAMQETGVAVPHITGDMPDHTLDELLRKRRTP